MEDVLRLFFRQEVDELGRRVRRPCARDRDRDYGKRWAERLRQRMNHTHALPRYNLAQEEVFVVAALLQDDCGVYRACHIRSKW